MIIFGFFFLTLLSILSLTAFFGFLFQNKTNFVSEIEFRILAAFFSLAAMGFSSLWINEKASFAVNLSVLLGVNAYIFYRVNWKFGGYLDALFPRDLVAPIVSWLLLGCIACVASSLSFNSPGNLPDGAYVYKSWTKNVQVQWASGDMPADNALPFFAGEFLIRDVNLQEVHPFAPGQEIVLRTFVVPFTYLTFRSFDLNASRDPSISYFSYVGTSWPNAMDFYSQDLYEIYTGVSIALQGFLVFAILLLAGRARKLWKQGIPAAIFLAIFPFIFQQTYFTWTKSLCTAFALLSIKTLIERKFLLSGLLIAMSYQIHPMALIFFCAISVYMLWKERQNFHKILIPFVASYAAWQIWVMSTGLKSDLIQQNLFIDQTLMMHVFARLGTLFNYLSPSFLNSYPPIVRNVLNSWMISGFSIALFFLISALLLKKFSIKRSGDEFALGVIGISSLMISTLVLSKPSVVIFFGGQLLLTITLAVAIRYANSWRLYLPWFATLAVGPYMWLQVLI
jgi:hypothetical protein